MSSRSSRIVRVKKAIIRPLISFELKNHKTSKRQDPRRPGSESDYIQDLLGDRKHPKIVKLL